MKRICVGWMALVFAVMMLPLQRISMSAPGSLESKLRSVNAKQSQESPASLVKASKLGEVLPVRLMNSSAANATLATGFGATTAATAFSTVQEAADLSVTKSDTPDPVIAGQHITYTITLTNAGPNPAQNVILTDAIPAGTAFVTATAPPGFFIAFPPGGTVFFSHSLLPVSGPLNFTLVVRVNPSTAASSIISNTATAASATTTDPDPLNNSATATTLVQTSADLAVLKTDSPDPVIAGENITYSLSLTNNGPSNAQNVTLADATPLGTTFVSATAPVGWAIAGPPVGGTGNVVFSIATLPPNAVANFTIGVKVSANVMNGSTITNTATAASNTPDPNGGNNSDTETTDVETAADLAVFKTDSPDPVVAGANITYTITLTNAGPSNAQNVTVTDTTPPGTTFVSATAPVGWVIAAPAVGSTGNVVFSLGTLPPPGNANFTIVVKVNPNTPGGTAITNQVTATTVTFESENTGVNFFTTITGVIAGADLVVTKTDSPDPVTAGANITYTITLTNNGPSDAQTVTLTDAVPTNTTFVSNQQNSGPAFIILSPPVGGTGNSVFSIATLAAGASASFTMVVNVNPNVMAGTIITNTATAASTTPDPGPGPNTATATTAVIVPPTVAKAFGATDLDIDGTTSMTLTITNPNTTALTGVAVSDTLPAGLVVGTPNNLSNTCGGTVTADPGTGLVSLTGGTVAGSGSCTISITVQGTTPGPKANTTGPISATESGAGATSNTATVTVHPIDLALTDPPVCLGPGGVVQVVATVTNAALSPQSITFTATLPPGLVAIPGSCTSTVGTCNVVNGSTVSLATTLGVGETAVIQYQAQLGDVPVDTVVCINAEVIFGTGTPIVVQGCTTVDCPPIGPGDPFPSSSVVSDQKAGSVLIYNLHTSNASMPNVQNARISVTNVNPTFSAFVHLFFIDGATCSMANSFVCLTANQTLTFLASDLDPGTTGYIVAVAVNSLGCPINFNFLIGDEYVKFASGHAANLAAEAVSALPGGLVPCDGASDSALLRFDNVSYGAVARVLAVDGIADKASGNDMLLAVNRIGGDFRQGALGIGNLFGILYNDQEEPHSWTRSTPNCQFVSLLSDSFPLTSPRFETVIPSGGTGWMRFWTTSDVGILGSKINFNPNVASSENAYNQGSNLHKLRLSTTSTITIPVFAPGC